MSIPRLLILMVGLLMQSACSGAPPSLTTAAVTAACDQLGPATNYSAQVEFQRNARPLRRSVNERMNAGAGCTTESGVAVAGRSERSNYTQGRIDYLQPKVANRSGSDQVVVAKTFDTPVGQNTVWIRFTHTFNWSFNHSQPNNARQWREQARSELLRAEAERRVWYGM